MDFPKTFKFVQRNRRFALTTRPSYKAFLLSYISIISTLILNLYLKEVLDSPQFNFFVNVTTLIIVTILILRLVHYRFFYRYDLIEGKSVSTKTGLLGLSFKEYDLDHVGIQLNQTILGKLFRFGNIGFEKDGKTATRWFAISNAPDVFDYIQSIKAGRSIFPSDVSSDASDLVQHYQTYSSSPKRPVVIEATTLPQKTSDNRNIIDKDSQNHKLSNTVKINEIELPRGTLPPFEDAIKFIENLTPFVDDHRKGPENIMAQVRRLYPISSKKMSFFKGETIVNLPIELVWYQVLNFEKYILWLKGWHQYLPPMPDPVHVGVDLTPPDRKAKDKFGNPFYMTVLECWGNTGDDVRYLATYTGYGHAFNIKRISQTETCVKYYRSAYMRTPFILRLLSMFNEKSVFEELSQSEFDDFISYCTSQHSYPDEINPWVESLLSKSNS